MRAGATVTALTLISVFGLQVTSAVRSVHTGSFHCWPMAGLVGHTAFQAVVHSKTDAPQIREECCRSCYCGAC